MALNEGGQMHTAEVGAQFYRCAFQVNPFAYVKRQGIETTYSDEASYNTAIVEACKANDIEVIAVTDHYRIGNSESLIEAATKAGIVVFPGFEAVTSDGIHFLCLADPDRRPSDPPSPPPAGRRS